MYTCSVLGACQACGLRNACAQVRAADHADEPWGRGSCLVTVEGSNLPRSAQHSKILIFGWWTAICAVNVTVACAAKKKKKKNYIWAAEVTQNGAGDQGRHTISLHFNPAGFCAETFRFDDINHEFDLWPRRLPSASDSFFYLARSEIYFPKMRKQRVLSRQSIAQNSSALGDVSVHSEGMKGLKCWRAGGGCVAARISI